jgi:geranylgeranyl pyrophosphate synthase
MRASDHADGEVERFLHDVDARLTPHLKAALAMVPNIEPLKRGMTHQVLSGGKRVRAALCAASCEMFGAPYEQALHFAAAIEHMQNFTLVHDDIADGDGQRRSQPSIWKQFGIGHGVNIGDGFIPLAAATILDAPYSTDVKMALLRAVTTHALQMVVGQTLDINMRSLDCPTTDEYIECARKKTGAFLALATVGGAIVGGASVEALGSLQRFALGAGVAFQIKDDLLDLVGGKGRDAGSDVMEGKRTLLVIVAGPRLSQERRRRMFTILNKSRGSKTRDEVAWVHEALLETGAVEAAELAAEDALDNACQQLGSLPPTEGKYRLLRIARYLNKRVH